MSQQYLRACSLVVATDTDALELGAFRVKFNVRQWTNNTPQVLTARIYNLSDSDAKAISKPSAQGTPEFTRVVLTVGYEGGDSGVLFDGTIKQVRTGRENTTDTYLDILGADSDAAYNFAVVSQSLAAGSTPADHVAVAAQAFGQYGVSTGFIPDLGATKLPRGKVLFGMARGVMNDVADTAGATWYMTGGQLNMINLTGVLPGEAVVLTSLSGLIGIPEQTIDGVKASCLINPKIIPGSKVQIDNKSIQTAQLSPDYSAINYFPRITEDGFYKVIVAEHEGDTRGQSWYSHLTCIGLDDGITAGLASKGYG